MIHINQARNHPKLNGGFALFPSVFFISSFGRRLCTKARAQRKVVKKTESMPTKSTACHRTLRIFWWIETGSLKRAEKRFFKLSEKQENALRYRDDQPTSLFERALSPANGTSDPA
jgi:hypothetical protein